MKTLLKLICTLCVFGAFCAQAVQIIVKPVNIEVTVSDVDNGCLVSALEVQVALLVQKDLSQVTWAKIVCVGRYDGKSHAYCVFALLNGDLWAYDPNINSFNLCIRNQGILAIMHALVAHDSTIKNGSFLD